MKEPQKLSMSTGLPKKDEVKKYPLKSNEQAFWDFIAQHEAARKKWREGDNEDNKTGD